MFKPPHGGEMRVHDPVGHLVGFLGFAAVPGFNGVQSVPAPLQRLFVILVIRRDGGVEIPA